MKTIAVLGANGQIANTLLRQLVRESDFKPVAVCRNQIGAAVIGDVACDVRVGSVADTGVASKLLGDCDAVVNCIWPNLPSKEMRPENEAIISNLAKLGNLSRLIHLSSVGVYGCIYSGSTFEKPRPDTSYGREKLALEKHITRLFSGSSVDYFILRLGHVYGPHQWLSRDVIDLAKSNGFNLPFDGDLPSNAIHVEELSSSLSWLAAADVASGVHNLAAVPQQTWRQVFDWHAKICGLPPVAALSDEDSRALRENYIKISQRSIITSCTAQTLDWLRSLPVQQLFGSGELRNLGSAVLGRMPLSVRNRVKSANALREVRRDIDALETSTIEPAAWIYSDAMPGRYLAPPSATLTGESSRREAEILEWYRARSGPQWSLAASAEAQPAPNSASLASA